MRRRIRAGAYRCRRPASAAAFSIWTWLLKKFPVGKVTVYNFLVPVFGTALSGIFLHEDVLTVRNLITVIKVEHRIGRLKDQQEFFRQRIEQDSTMLERLNYDEYLEQYAREKFHMQRSDEHVYIMED